MDENPYKAPQAESSGAGRFRPWDWLAIIGGVGIVVSTLVRELTEMGTSANDYARIGHEIGGILLIVWCAVTLTTKVWPRLWLAVLVIVGAIAAIVLAVREIARVLQA